MVDRDHGGVAQTQFPSGDVTFLFTDIEGSTRLWERDATTMWRALDQHHTLLRSAIETHGGIPFKTIGDAFQAAFASSQAAVAAAVEAQRALSVATWDETGPIRVRMAIHVGEAHPAHGDYTAPCLNRLARLLSTGYGGQVLLTDAVRRRVGDALPHGVTLRNLGRHRLRDLLEPEQVAQIAIADLPDHFPPLKSLERFPTNLPIQPTELVGRGDDLAAAKSLLRRVSVRLLTLTGAGGTGKTRLALQVAAEEQEAFAGGVFLIDLAPLAEPTLVLPTIARTLGVRESGGLTLREALVAYLTDKRLLLLLDNFEQVVEAAASIAALLAEPSCRHLKLLVTSREVLRVQGEEAYLVPPLPTPNLRRLPPPAELGAIGAVALFVQRATTARSDFALTVDNARAVAEICVRLDGLPLAIELAAARTKLLAPHAVLTRLENRLKLLTGGARDLPERQRTLRATIEWSHDQLTEDERVLFRRLSVFAGGGPFDAVEVVAGAAGNLAIDLLDGLEGLIDKSLLRQSDTGVGEMRLLMLETLREFGLEQLIAAGEEATTRRAHAEWSFDLAATLREELASSEQADVLRRLDDEHGNVRAALAWGLNTEPESALRLATSLGRFWRIRGYLSEGRSWLTRALKLNSTAPVSIRIAALIEAGTLAADQGDFAESDAFNEEGLTLARESGDRRQYARLLNLLGGGDLERGDLDRASALLEESLAILEELGDHSGYASALTNLGSVAHYEGDLTRARERYIESLGLWRQLGEKVEIGTVLFNLLTLSLVNPDQFAQARAYGDECLLLSRELGEPQGEAFALEGLALVARAEGDLHAAESHYEQSRSLFQDLGDKNGVARALGGLGLTALDQGDLRRAASFFGESLRGFAAIADNDGFALALEGLAEIASAQGRFVDGARLLGAAEMIRETIGVPPPSWLQPRQQLVRDEVQGRLDPPDLDQAWQEWRARSIEDLTTLAVALVAELLAASPPPH